MHDVDGFDTPAATFARLKAGGTTVAARKPVFAVRTGAEVVGGGRNLDDRFCRLRDPSVTVRALFALGYAEEAESFLSWLLHATRLTWPELGVMYDVYGGTRLRERELPHLGGFGGSRPP